LNSITNQTFPDIEIILINDGSSDGSGEKCLAWAKRDSRIIYVSKKNEGQGPTRNLGIRMASAEFLAFCDPDDWYDEKYIELMLAKQHETEADIVICGYYKYDGGFERVTAAEINESLEGKLKNWAWQFFASVCMKLFRKSLFIDHDIKMPACVAEDFAINYFILAKAKKIAAVGQALYFYFMNRPGSTTSSCSRHKLDILPATIYGLDLFAKDNIFEGYKKDLLDRALELYNYYLFLIRDDTGHAEKLHSDCTKMLNKYFGEMAKSNEKTFAP
jgi:glycosyltransferase involved in cell wall biosynthesis